MRLHFLGAAREVTGSCCLVDTGAVRFLVDCGMFQGGRETRAKNHLAFDFDVRELAFVLLTHAHIDHSGLIPRLHAQGFNGPIYCTQATADLLQVMLPDSGHIQEKEAEWENFRHGKPRRLRRDLAPLYTVAQAQASLRLLKPIAYEAEFTPRPEICCRFSDAGHILGSAIIEVWVTHDGRTRKLVFSGDLGQRGHPLVRDPTPMERADILLVESTYGNRLHRGLAETLDELVYAIESTLRQRKGNIIVSAFAVGRTQDMLYLLADLTRQGRPWTSTWIHPWPPAPPGSCSSTWISWTARPMR